MDSTYSRILFANIGWMISYKGQSSEDLISGGGSYSDADKHEAFNFQNLNGYCYGYFEPTGDNVNLSRIDETLNEDEDKIEKVTVVWFAPNKIIGGSWIVGWYKNAIVYRSCQKSTDSQRNQYGYFVKAKTSDCVLLPVDERTFRIPRQEKNYPGRSNVWYADSPEVEKFKAQVVDYIDSYSPLQSKHHSFPIHISVEERKKIEQSAIKAVKNLYETRKYSVIDVQSENKGWDLEAIKGKHKLYLEVKGQGKHEPFIRITRNEYEQMKKNKSKYRLCIVLDSLNEADIYIFLSQNDKWICENDDSIILTIDEKIQAIATFQEQ